MDNAEADEEAEVNYFIGNVNWLPDEGKEAEATPIGKRGEIYEKLLMEIEKLEANYDRKQLDDGGVDETTPSCQSNDIHDNGVSITH